MTKIKKIYYAAKKIPVAGKILQHVWQLLSLNYSFNRIKKFQSKTAFYQPLYGYMKYDESIPQRPCADRADVIYAALSEMGPTRLLDVGCSFGYFSYFLAERGYLVDAIDSDINCINICKSLTRFNSANVCKIRQAVFDQAYIDRIPLEKYDIVLLLSVLHHITTAMGLPYVQQMMKSLVEKIPVLVVELAVREEDVSFPWKQHLPEDPLEVFVKCENIEIKLLGYFSTHLSSIKRPLYMICNRRQKINARQFEIISRRFVSHEDAHHYFRVFYETDDVFIKNYRLQHTEILQPCSGKKEILNEIGIYQKLPESAYFPKMLDYSVEENSIKILLSKLPGKTLKYHIENHTPQLNPARIVRRVLEALRVLRNVGYYHNDIRPWNIMVDAATSDAWLFDLGYVSRVERESTNIALLWIIYQLQQNKSKDYLKMTLPLAKRPPVMLEMLDPELREIAGSLMKTQSIDEFFQLSEVKAVSV